MSVSVCISVGERVWLSSQLSIENKNHHFFVFLIVLLMNPLLCLLLYHDSSLSLLIIIIIIIQIIIFFYLFFLSGQLEGEGGSFVFVFVIFRCKSRFFFCEFHLPSVRFLSSFEIQLKNDYPLPIYLMLKTNKSVRKKERRRISSTIIIFL